VPTKAKATKASTTTKATGGVTAAPTSTPRAPATAAGSGTRWYGKYRGTVAANADPLQQGRLQVEVPAVSGAGHRVWAMPCVPFVGSGAGWWAAPDVGAGVWVEYEGGDPDLPIWSGCFWNPGQALPDTPSAPTRTVLRSHRGRVVLDDGPGALTIELTDAVTAPTRIVLDSHGVELRCGAAAVVVGPAGISLRTGPTTLALGADGAVTTTGDSKLALGPDGATLQAVDVALTAGPATASLAAAGIELALGAASVAMTPTAVSVNHGALEVV
jgi:uncharacterized protein involved in type VI secretion and phage assembly